MTGTQVVAWIMVCLVCFGAGYFIGYMEEDDD